MQQGMARSSASKSLNSRCALGRVCGAISSGDRVSAHSLDACCMITTDTARERHKPIMHF